MIKNIIFDMGNVLLDFQPEEVLRRFCREGEERDTIRRELFQAPEWLMADRGLFRDCDRFDRVKGNVPEEYHPALKNCCDLWWTVCMGPLPGAREFVRDCKAAGYKVYILSNASDLFFTYFKNFSPLDWFDGAVISFQELLLKPEAEIYQRLFRRYGLHPEECYFIDDRADNVEAGRAQGMSGHVFRNDYPAIRAELRMLP